MAFGAAGVGIPVGSPCRMVLVGNLVKRLLCVPKSPCGVVELGGRRRRVGGDADAPAFVEKQRRAQVRCVEEDFGGSLRTSGGGSSMAVRMQQVFQRGMGRRLLGNELHRSAYGQANQHNQSSQGNAPTSACTPL